MRATFPLTGLLLAYALIPTLSRAALAPPGDLDAHPLSPLYLPCISQVISMRTLALLGKCDPGAPRAFAVHILLASLLVATP